MRPAVTLFVVVTVKQGKENRCEELWRSAVDYLEANWKDDVSFRVLQQPGTTPSKYVFIEDFSSEKIRDEWMVDPWHLAFNKQMKTEELVEEKIDVENGELRWLKEL